MVTHGPVRKLTPKQQRFIEEYLVDLNATRAAVGAGYSENSAQQMGSENLSKPVIQEAIQAAMVERSGRTGITQDAVIEGLKKEAALVGEGSSHSARVAAWAHLGKHLGMFVEKHNLSHTLTTKIINLPAPGHEYDHLKGTEKNDKA